MTENCPYCNNLAGSGLPTKRIMHIDDAKNYDTELFDLYVSNGNLKIEAVDNYFFYLDEQVKINYCPMCGRKTRR